MRADHAYLSGLAVAGPDSFGSRVFDVSQLFEKAFGISRYSPAARELEVGEEEIGVFFDWCRRYAAGEPLQYLLGEWEFYGLPFEVGAGVLIPQPDTETLVETALELLKGRTAPVVADLCAGSGCVAITIAKECPDARVYAVELSEVAVAYLERNIQRNEVSVERVRGDVFSPPELPEFDLVVSNPPYLSREELGEVSAQVRCEPELALLGGEDGLEFYRRLPALYFTQIKSGGFLALEVGYTQAESVARFLQEAGYGAVEVRQDLAGIARVVFAQKP